MPETATQNRLQTQVTQSIVTSTNDYSAINRIWVLTNYLAVEQWLSAAMLACIQSPEPTQYYQHLNLFPLDSL